MLAPIVLLLLALPTAAHAYVDPGTGSLVIQAVLASAVGVGVVMRRHVRAFVDRMRGRTQAETASAPAAPESDEAR